MNTIITILLTIGVGLILLKIIYEIIKENKIPKHKDIHIKTCPVCGSLKTIITINKNGIGLCHKCKECDYDGEMLEINLEQIQDKINNKNKEN